MSEKKDLPVPKDLLDILVCPVCKKQLTLGPEKKSLNCETCHVAYPIRDGIPVLLADQSVPF